MVKTKKKHQVSLSDAQKEIMRIVWEKGEVAALDVHEVLSKNRDVSKNTIRTLMERMEEKGWLKHRVMGRTYMYRAEVSKDESLGQWVHDTLDRFFGGDPKDLVMALLKHRGLSKQESENIEKMLKNAKKGIPPD